MLLPVNKMCIYTYTYIFIPLSYNAIIGFDVLELFSMLRHTFYFIVVLIVLLFVFSNNKFFNFHIEIG